MSQSDHKVVQYLSEAAASELGLVRVLQSQIAITPRGPYRDALDEHLGETRDHARRVKERLRELDGARSPLQAFVGFAETLIGQSVALSKAPFDLLRGSGGEEKVLKQAKDACASEALEIATYTALERLANGTGDQQTASLAASIREDEQQMLDRILEELPELTDAVLAAVEGQPSYDLSRTGAADAARALADEVKHTAGGLADEVKHAASETEAQVRRTARQARKVPGVAGVEGQLKGAVASEDDLPIADYDSLTAEEIVGKLSELSQIELAEIDSYERRNDNRSTVLGRISTLRHREPWPGYDELTVGEIEAVLSDSDEQRVKDVLAYERAHKNRVGVLRSVERETINA